MSRRALHVLLATLALAVWGSVVFRFAALSAEDAPPQASPGRIATASAGEPFVLRSDYADPFFYGPGARDTAATVPAVPPPAPERSALAPPPPEGGFYGPPPRAEEPLPYVITGIMGSVAILQAPDGQTVLVRRGDWLGDAEIIAVDRSSVSLRIDSRTHLLSLASAQAPQ